MIERKFISAKKTEYAIKEFVKKQLGKGKVSNIQIERTPIGERIIVYTSKPGLVIGRRGETINETTIVLKKQFKLENPKIEIAEIPDIEFDAQTVADRIAMAIERFGPSTFKMRAYRELERLKKEGALGVEIVLGGKLPGERAKSWRFAFGYLKKTGETDIVNKAQATAKTIPGVVGIKVMIVPKGAIIPDKIEISKAPVIIEEKKEEIKEQKETEKLPTTEIPTPVTEEKPKKTRKKKGETKETEKKEEIKTEEKSTTITNNTEKPKKTRKKKESEEK